MGNNNISSFNELFEVIDNLPQSIKKAISAMIASHDCRDRALAMILIELLLSKKIDPGIVYKVVCED